MLVPIKHDLTTTLFCGPAALSTTTGIPTSKIVKILKKISKSSSKLYLPYKFGTYPEHLEKAALALGYRLEPIRTFDRTPARKFGEGNIPCHWTEFSTRPSFPLYTRLFARDFQDYPVIVQITGRSYWSFLNHYAAVYRHHFCDNFTMKPVFLSKSPHRCSRVSQVWQVLPLSSPPSVV